MEEKIVHYEINPETMALIPMHDTEWVTLVVEVGREFLVNVPILTLIEQACLEGGASYDGRREAVNHLLGVRNKIPIPIDPNRRIFTFPTHSPKQYECMWIFYPHVKTIAALPSQDHVAKTVITFQNGKQVEVPVSHYTIEKQMLRTATCVFRFTHELPKG